jgi:hypothetical protein
MAVLTSLGAGADGKSTQEAFRALKRFLARRIWHLWRECLASSILLRAAL